MYMKKSLSEIKKTFLLWSTNFFKNIWYNHALFISFPFTIIFFCQKDQEWKTIIQIGRCCPLSKYKVWSFEICIIFIICKALIKSFNNCPLVTIFSQWPLVSDMIGPSWWRDHSFHRTPVSVKVSHGSFCRMPWSSLDGLNLICSLDAIPQLASL